MKEFEVTLTAVSRKTFSIGILNVQKRIKLLCGREYGLSYTENPAGGVTAHLLLPMNGGNVT